jgi:site-specific DNA-adenine methylase
MRNHYIMPYSGNKREEVETIYTTLIEKDILNKKIDTIIEPYCGSSAISYYISLQSPLKYKYILNDNSKILIDLYEILKENEKISNFIETVNDMTFKDNIFIDKEEYLRIVKQKDVYSYFIKNKLCGMRPGVYPQDRPGRMPKHKLDFDKFMKTPIINFIQTENIEFRNEDAIKVMLSNNNDSTLLLVDPPYLMTCNSFYDNHNSNIYEWIYNNHGVMINCVFILENTWLIKLLFKDYNIVEYDKVYRCSQKASKHAIYY